MSFRRRLSSLAAIAVAVSIAAASLVTYLIVGHQLHSQVDASLQAIADGATLNTGGTVSSRSGRLKPANSVSVNVVPTKAAKLTLPVKEARTTGGYAQAVDPGGSIISTAGRGSKLPVDDAVTSVAQGKSKPFFDNVEVGGGNVRVLTAQLSPGEAVQIARPLDEVDATMRRLALILGLITSGGIGLAAILGRAVAARAVSPVTRLTDTAEHIASTRDLSARIDAGDAGDELDRLAKSFNRMLGELEAAEGAQRQLVADASHELRTPLTSLRTNIEVLSRPGVLPEDDRRRLLSDVVSELDELGGLVSSLVDLARDERELELPEELRFDELVAGAVERARRSGACFDVSVEPCLVTGAPDRLDRAVANLLDNAAKWSPPTEAIEVALTAGGVLTVRDHGPGIAPEDLPHVFDRFYRAPGARGMVGSGLGLAIVQQVAEAHGGTVYAAAGPGSGTTLTLEVPALDFSENSLLALS